MRLTRVDVSGFRILADIGFVPHPALTLLTGRNGAGKSSVLEAIHCLSTGHSFRTRKPRELITHGADAFSVTAQLQDSVHDQEHRIGLSRSRDGTMQFRLDYESVDSIVQATRLLPIKALSPDSHALVQDGPDERRRFLDWGVFHVEPTFIDAWRQYKRSLSQRNQALREQLPDAEVTMWNEQLAQSGTAIDQLRRRYVDALGQAVAARLSALSASLSVDVAYRGGWSSDATLAEALEQHIEHHRRMKTTTDGPHRAELTLTTNGLPVRQVLSRGQQKLLVYLLHLAQLDLLNASGSKSAVVLCDDLPSELDDEACNDVVSQLLDGGSQVLVSGVSLAALKHRDHALFHVEQGRWAQG